jgi:hypothetical protein
VALGLLLGHCKTLSIISTTAGTVASHGREIASGRAARLGPVAAKHPSRAERFTPAIWPKD